MTSEPEPIASYRVDIPRDLESILRQCMAKSRTERFASMGALAHALERYASDQARVHVQRASAASKIVRSNSPEPMDDVVVVSVPKTAQPPIVTASFEAEEPAEESAGFVPESSRAKPKKNARVAQALWIALGIVTCLGAVTLGAFFARGPSAKSEAVTPASATSQPAIVAVPTAAATSAPKETSLSPVEAAPVAAPEVVRAPPPSSRKPSAVASSPSSLSAAPSVVPAARPSAGAAPSAPPRPPAPATSAEKDSWKWGDRN
jgi:hypothetical protein